MKTPRVISAARQARRLRLDAFTLIELLVVISIIAVLAGFVVGLAPVASRRMKDARLRVELTQVVGAIEAYKARFGVYPPDNYDPIRRVTNPVTNSLFYELTGVLADNQQEELVTADDNTTITPAIFQQYFGREGVLNSVPRIQGPAGDATRQAKLDREQKKLLMRRDFKPSQFAELFRRKTDPGYVDLEVLAVGFSGDASGKKASGFSWPTGNPADQQPVPTNPGLNPWRYVSTTPTNNPGRFDVWAEIREGNRTNIVGNW